MSHEVFDVARSKATFDVEVTLLGNAIEADPWKVDTGVSSGSTF